MQQSPGQLVVRSEHVGLQILQSNGFGFKLWQFHFLCDLEQSLSNSKHDLQVTTVLVSLFYITDYPKIQWLNPLNAHLPGRFLYQSHFALLDLFFP